MKGGAFEVQQDNLFGVGASDGINKGKFDDDWVVGRKRYEYDEVRGWVYCIVGVLLLLRV